ncbi:MAG: cardiolipin synthase [Gammaproteobacteria bacterium]|nr:cardiolipin synthase [Gammaproteobacteria bacterium]MDH4254549.1 cardiolipin synthase [Gammaproteobacteria bacterium]MDH5310399.1 cardiolipin synthase [Gammaproteobacteria bacterium]
MEQAAVEMLQQPGSIELIAILYASLQFSGIVAAGHAIFNARSAQGATAWAIALIAAPIAALPFYLVFGRNRFVGYVDARRSADTRHSWIANQARNVCNAFRSELQDRGGRLRSLERLAHLPFTYANRVDLLVDGQVAFAAMFDAIRRAEKYVLIQFFIVRNDDLGEKLKALLIEKARAGIRIYFLYDELGSNRLSNKFVRQCREAGIRIEPFRSSKGFTIRFQINFRNHRKTLIIDGDYAFLGGLNVGDEYLGKSSRFGPWRDTHVSVEGPAADAVQLIFTEDWHWATGETIENLDWQARPAPNSNADVLILPSGPADDYESCSLMFVQAIHSAEQRFWIASPYFVPNEEIIAALQLAGLRGVDVRILLPANPDHLMVYFASFAHMKATGSRGIRFYRYTEGFMHQKAFLIDDVAAGVGTANLDNRSFRLNFEITLLSTDRPFAAEVEAMFEQDFAKSLLVPHDDIDRRSLPFKIASAAARLMSPIL